MSFKTLFSLFSLSWLLDLYLLPGPNSVQHFHSEVISCSYIKWVLPFCFNNNIITTILVFIAYSNCGCLFWPSWLRPWWVVRWGADDAVSHFRDGVSHHPFYFWGARTLHTLPQGLRKGFGYYHAHNCVALFFSLLQGKLTPRCLSLSQLTCNIIFFYISMLSIASTCQIIPVQHSSLRSPQTCFACSL